MTFTVVSPALSPRRARGVGLAILVNANAKRGGRRVAVQIARALPGSSVRLTRSPQEIEAWLRVLDAPRCVLAAGGDGTVVALLNALARVIPPNRPLPPMGILPLGTGNGWAHSLGAPKLHVCLDLLSGRAGWDGAPAPGPGLSDGAVALPTRRCDVIEVEGMLAHFAGSGWDAMILDDYSRQLERSKGPGKHLSKSVYGYVSATFLRTAPKVALYGNPTILVENLGERVFAIDARGSPRELPGMGPGSILYEGPAGTVSAGTCTEFGYRFRAFPFAERMPGFFDVRVYNRGALGATRTVPRLWKGAWPLAGMRDWLASGVRISFSREVPLQIGGDAHGSRRSVELRVSPRPVRMLDWRRLRISG